jgi:hypothetical protein
VRATAEHMFSKSVEEPVEPAEMAEPAEAVAEETAETSETVADVPSAVKGEVEGEQSPPEE